MCLGISNYGLFLFVRFFPRVQFGTPCTRGNRQSVVIRFPLSPADLHPHGFEKFQLPSAYFRRTWPPKALTAKIFRDGRIFR